MKKILVKKDGIVIDESGILQRQEDIEFFISQRPDYECEIVDATAEVEAENQKKDRKKLALERLQSSDLKGATIAQLRAELKQIVDDLKEVFK